VGAPEILTQLKLIAPVFAVRGNVDTETWAEELPLTVVGRDFRLPFLCAAQSRDLDLKPQAAGFDAVISGHTHAADQQEDSGVLYLNPGSAGPRRFQLPVTLALVELSKKPWRVELVRLLGP